MVLPSHFPLLAGAEGLCGGRGRAAGPAAGGLRPVCQPLAGGSGDWHLEEEGLCAFGFFGVPGHLFPQKF